MAEILDGPGSGQTFNQAGPKPRKTAAKAPAQLPAGKRRPRLTTDDLSLILRLTDQGKSTRQIAALLTTPDRRVSQSTVSQWLNRARTPNEELIQVLNAHRQQAIEGWSRAITTGARYGKHAPARDLLQATGTIQRDSAPERLTIIVGDGSAIIGQLPALPRALAPAPAPEPITIPASQTTRQTD